MNRHRLPRAERKPNYTRGGCSDVGSGGLSHSGFEWNRSTDDFTSSVAALAGCQP